MHDMVAGLGSFAVLVGWKQVTLTFKHGWLVGVLIMVFALGWQAAGGIVDACDVLDGVVDNAGG